MLSRSKSPLSIAARMCDSRPMSPTPAVTVIEISRRSRRDRPGSLQISPNTISRVRVMKLL